MSRKIQHQTHPKPAALLVLDTHSFEPVVLNFAQAILKVKTPTAAYITEFRITTHNVQFRLFSAVEYDELDLESWFNDQNRHFVFETVSGWKSDRPSYLIIMRESEDDPTT